MLISCFLTTSDKSAFYMMNRHRPRTDLCGTEHMADMKPPLMSEIGGTLKTFYTNNLELCHQFLCEHKQYCSTTLTSYFSATSNYSITTCFLCCFDLAVISSSSLFYYAQDNKDCIFIQEDLLHCSSSISCSSAGVS